MRLNSRSPQHRGACPPAPHNIKSKPFSAFHIGGHQRSTFLHLCTSITAGLHAIGPNNTNSNTDGHNSPSSSETSPISASFTQGLARTILAQPGIEGDPLAFLEVSEAYWRALRNQKHEPHKKGPTVVSYADGPLPALLPLPISPLTTATTATTKTTLKTSLNGSSSGSGSGTIPATSQTLTPSPPPSSSTTIPKHQQDQQHQQDQTSAHQGEAVGPQRKHDFDVVICGGTLGLFLATALQLRGWRVAIVEKRLVQGRNQEWNISWGELEVLLELGLLSREELREAVASEFNPIRVGFLGGKDMWTSDVLNLGVHPRRLLEALRRRFEAAGGLVYENTAFRAATIHTDGLRLKLSPGGSAAPLAVGDTNRPNGLGSTGSSPGPVTAPRSLNCRLLLDCMGHYSDIVKQIRGRVKPDGMCMVVGSCAEGFPSDLNQSADLLYSLSHVRYDMQLFWEAFPAEGGRARTTYMFAYSDAHPDRPTFEQLLDTYFEMLPQYQGLSLEQLRFKRVLFGGFPCYNNGPLPPAFDRVMQIGDASAAQSPLSFGGFGSMMRHLGRLTRGLDQALAEDRLTRGDLNWLLPYQPSLSASWLFQRSMSLGVGQVDYPQDYPYIPPYYAASADAAAATGSAMAMSESLATTMILGAGAGPAAAFQEAIAMAAARFAAGAADPADYFHEEPDPEAERSPPLAAAAAMAMASAPMAAEKPATAAKGQQNEQQQQMVLFERDFRLSPSWLKLPFSHVNEILGCNFGVMGVLGDRVLRPFLQDTIQLLPLSLSMVGMMLANPLTVSRVLLQVGPQTLVGWFVHYTALLAFSLTYQVLRPMRQFVPYYTFQRLVDALEYGSGSDYRYHGPSGTTAMTPLVAAVKENRVMKGDGGGADTGDEGAVLNEREHRGAAGATTTQLEIPPAAAAAAAAPSLPDAVRHSSR